MIVCVDLDHTITAAPEFYKTLMASLRPEGTQVHILSGTHTTEVTPEEVTEKLALLAKLGFQKGREYDEAVAVPGPEENVPASKVAYMQHVGATALFDDRKENIQAVRKAGFIGLRHKSPK